MRRRRMRIGWYVHHQGAGHATRFAAIRQHLDADVVVFSTAAAAPGIDTDTDTEWVTLERDDTVEVDARRALDPHESDPGARGLLHWAPLRHRGHAARLARIAERIGSDRFDAFVVDVSAEVTLLVRLLGMPTVIVAQPGERTDAPHRMALQAADAVIAPWPGALYRPHWLQQAGDRVHFVGGISRFAGRERTRQRTSDAVLLLAGSGGSTTGAETIERTIGATPGFSWQVLGGSAVCGPGRGPISGPVCGAVGPAWLADPFDAICGAGVVVSWAGQNAIGDLAVTGARSIVIAQPRAFGEQAATAAILSQAGLSVVRPQWPAAADWAALLTEASRLDPDWSLWQTTGAGERAARVIETVAAS